MNDGVIIAWITVGLSVLAGLGTVYKLFSDSAGRREAARQQASDAEVSADSARFSENLALTKYIREQVDLGLKEPRQRIADLEAVDKEREAREATRTRAFTRILRSIMAQWPHGIDYPQLDPEDVAAIEETIPPQWLANPRGN